MSKTTQSQPNFDLQKFASSVLDFVDVTGRAVEHGHAASVAMQKQAAAAEQNAPQLADLMLTTRQIAPNERDAAVKAASTYTGVCDMLKNAVNALHAARVKLAAAEANAKIEIGTPGRPQKTAADAGRTAMSAADQLLMEYTERHARS